MRFDPKSQEAITAARLWPAGIYPFEIVKGEEKPSQAGNDMIELKLRLSGPSGKLTITDYLLEKRIEKMLHAAQVCGLLTEYYAGNLNGGDFIGKRGRVKVGVENGKEGHRTKNVVLEYLSDNTGLIVHPARNAQVALIVAKYRRK